MSDLDNDPGSLDPPADPDERPADDPGRPDDPVAPNLGGRPTKYKPEFVQQAEKLCLLGATDDQIADFFGIGARTLYRWKHEHPEFCAALKAGKELADRRVERSLYQRAVGFEQDEVKIFMPAGAVKPIYAPFRAKHPPDVTACIFWLKNRKPDQWRDKQEHEVTNRHDPREMSEAELDAAIERARERAGRARAAAGEKGEDQGAE